MGSKLGKNRETLLEVLSGNKQLIGCLVKASVGVLASPKLCTYALQKFDDVVVAVFLQR